MTAKPIHEIRISIFGIGGSDTILLDHKLTIDMLGGVWTKEEMVEMAISELRVGFEREV